MNQKFYQLVGRSEEEVAQLSIRDITHPEDLEANSVYMRQFHAGEIDEKQVEKRYLRPDGTAVWTRVAISCVRDEKGEIEYFIRVIEDISAEREAKAHQKLLIGELNHRVKNSLATIQSMASQTMRSTGDMQTFADRFSGRLRAMATAHESIFAGDGLRADLATLIEKQLFPYVVDMNRLRLEGPAIQLNDACVHGLSLVFHELATNASKYGALSTGEGYINVTWRLEPAPGGGTVYLAWQESGRTELIEPKQTGFGTRLIETMLQQTLQGAVHSDFRPDGLVTEMTFKLDEPDDGRQGS